MDSAKLLSEVDSRRSENLEIASWSVRSNVQAPVECRAVDEENADPVRVAGNIEIAEPGH